MRFPHAAAVALMGWYLMLLPKNDPSIGLWSVPFSAIQRSFDTAGDCEQARASAVVPPLAPTPLPSATPTPQANTSWFGSSEPSEPTVKKTPKAPEERAFYCISADDPRLKGTD